MCLKQTKQMTTEGSGILWTMYHLLFILTDGGGFITGVGTFNAPDLRTQELGWTQQVEPNPH